MTTPNVHSHRHLEQPATRMESGRPPVKPLNTVVEACPPSGIRRFFDIARQMENVISLGVGEPDFVTPWRIREAGIWALEHGYTTYTSNNGLLPLRERICARLQQRYGASYDPATECLITVGVSEGLDLALRVLLNPGDEVIVPEPCYVSYVPMVRFAGGVPVLIPTGSTDGFQIDPERVEAAVTPRTKALLLGSPSNPTGSVQPREVLQALVDLANRHDFYLISDEIYDRLTYLGEHICMASIPGARERTIVLNGFSKAYAMTGWRIGYACAPEPIATLMTRVHQYTMLCAPHIAQMAAIEALDHAEGDVEHMVADYNRRRRLFVNGLNRIGLDCHEPAGAFYAFPSIRRTGLDSETFAERLLMEERVAVVPGNAFGASGEGFVRCSYATALPQLEEALERMGRFVTRIGLACLLAFGVLMSGMARADRMLFAPDGAALPPDSFRLEYAINPERRNASFAWAQYASPDGIEMELHRLDLERDTKNRYAFNLQYPLLQDLGATPALSVGARDLTLTGQERLSLFFAAGKSVPLSDRQARLVKELRWSAGIGTSFFNGAFLGARVRFRGGLTVITELVRYRPNVALAFPLVRNLQARAYSFDGNLFFGLNYALIR
ncbi:MAG: aminotransferase class I/II-fold pyridoxal phosphate-dependent enzyme [Chloroherpetonaceae bacterium]|nr:aminotransferase class I/II-fold pyridoxal phosphate-dependent enzyme [Chthonomonadaceae bacterium]MDW8206862.1 aminotransferase class I/II-fold pyridoxal phosphate-dependent enzyme [Chloroherpetonaceae bacterium]